MTIPLRKNRVASRQKAVTLPRVINFLQVILLGVIEGITEFLPISSTGHLLIAEHWLGERPDAFTIVIQLGAIVAVLLIYWNHIVDLLKHASKPENRDYLFKQGVAFGITVVGGLIISLLKLKLPEKIAPVAWAMLIGGILLFAAEWFLQKKTPRDEVTWKIAIAMGLAQLVAAVFPGTSRSAATIIIAMLLGQSRPAATEFAFILGIPTMFAASVLALFKARHELMTTGGQEFIDIGVGFIVSGIVAFIAVKWLLTYIRSHTFNIFAAYRIVLGLALLDAIYFGWLH